MTASPDLVSLVVSVQPVEAGTVPGHLGRAVHALLLRWLSGVDEALARRWHDDSGLKPFACSSLVGAKRLATDSREVTAERRYWFRLCTLERETSAALLAVAANLPPEADLDNRLFRVLSATADHAEHPWAGTADYTALAAPHLLAGEKPPRRVTMQFASPTAFHVNGMNMAVPLPDLVFGGLADRWNAFSPVAVSPEVRRFCQSGLALSGFRLKSRGLPMKDGGLQVGGVGEARYVSVRYDRYWQGVVTLLAEYARFAGVGRGTAWGMGQARRLADTSGQS